ncbi:hypothetical protein [Staphylococcus epidermidis]|uniref:hypothetical protein n=1 Tax=Staphylococcus epidermidis TaxID=1282 RepID=UPI00287703FE|nr:hypothetical protein [Staphylococcus epidermidis]MDS0998467.1 hypothetical protein [Staphylococcus epidermidis]
MFKSLSKILGVIFLICVVMGLLLTGLIAISHMNELAGNILSIIFAIVVIVLSIIAVKLTNNKD